MREQNIRKILGNRLYSVYRRMRYLRYLKKVRKTRRKQLKFEQLSEDQQYRLNHAQQKSKEKKQARARKKRVREELRQEKGEHRAAMRKQVRLDKIREKNKKRVEKEEQKQARKEARMTITQLTKEEKKQERERQRQLQLEQKQEREEIRIRMQEKANHDRQLTERQKISKKEQKEERKRKLKELRPYLYKRRKRELIRTLKSINAGSIRKGFRYLMWMVENKSERNLFLIITINSVSLFVLSYLTLYILAELITLYAAQSFNYDMILFYYKIYFNIDSDQWTADAVKILYSIKPLAGLVIGTIAIIIFSTLKNINSLFKLYFLWLFVHGMVMFFGSLLLGTLLNQGFGWVIAYLYYKDTGKMVFSIIAIFALVVTGASIARSFVISGNAYFNSIDRDNRKFLLISQVLIPVLLGTIITSLMKVPNDLYYTTTEEVIYEILKLSSILILVIPIIISFSSIGSIFFDEEPRKASFHWVYIALSFVVFFGYRYLLLNGIVISI